MKKVLFAVFAVVMAMAMLFGCAAPAAEPKKTTEPVAVAAKTIPFALINPLSGPVAPWGIGTVRAFTLGADEVNDAGGFTVAGQKYKWEIIQYDSKMTPAEAINGTKWAVYDKGAKFISIMGADPTMAVRDITEKEGVINITTSPPSTKYPMKDMPLTYWCAGGSSSRSFMMWFNYMKNEKGVKTIASLNPKGVVGDVMKSYVVDAAKQIGGLTITANEQVDTGTTDFYPVLNKILPDKPDLLMSGALGSGDAALMLKQARELGYKGIFVLAWAPSEKTVNDIAGQAAEGAYGVAMTVWQTASQKDLYNRFAKKWDIKDIDVTVALYGKVLPSFTKAIEKANSFDPTKINAVFENSCWDYLDNCDAAWTGTETFGIKRGLLTKGTILSQWVNGKAEFVKVVLLESTVK